MQLLITFLWGTPTAKTHITWCSVAVVRFQHVLASSGVLKKHSLTETRCVYANPQHDHGQIFELRARYPTFVRCTKVFETRYNDITEYITYQECATLHMGSPTAKTHITCLRYVRATYPGVDPCRKGLEKTSCLVTWPNHINLGWAIIGNWALIFFSIVNYQANSSLVYRHKLTISRLY